MSTPRFRKNDIIAYEDMANPRTLYFVTAHHPKNPWATYTLCAIETGDIIFSDCRQRGWTLVNR